ncbi:MAG: hypothetical protein ACFCU6_03895, partial [Balneolaceae bacterium]
MFIRLLLISTLLCLIPFTASAQLDEGNYLKIDYLIVDNSKEDQFLKTMKTTINDLQKKRVNNNEILYWRLYKVIYPGSRDTQYNYVTVSSATSINPFENESVIG